MSSVTLGKFLRHHFLNIVFVVRDLEVALGEFWLKIAPKTTVKMLVCADI